MAEDGRNGLIISRQPLSRSFPSRGSSPTIKLTNRTHSSLQALESVSGRTAPDNDYCDLPPTKDQVKNNNESPANSPAHSTGDTRSERQNPKFIIVPSSEKSPKAPVKVLKVVKREPNRTSDSVNSHTPLHVEGKADLCSYCGLCRCERCRASNTLPHSWWLCNSRCLCSPESVLEHCTCVCCVQGLFYHCAEDTEDDYRYADEPCSCDPHKRCLRFSCMGLLSLALPCLWCYWPGRGCLECLRLCRAQGRKGCECVDKPVKV